MQQRILKYLGALAVSAGLGTASVGTGLLEVPTEVMTEVIEENGEEAPVKSRDRLRLMGLLAQDERPVIRARVAEAVGGLFAEQGLPAEELLAQLAEDPSSSVRRSAARGLITALADFDSRERGELASAWAGSDHPLHRAAVARALASLIRVPGSKSLIQSLCTDEQVEVRRAAVIALAHHYDQAPAHYRAMTFELLDDPDPRTRAVALRVIARHA